jgi:creatinine amidohydrolase
MPPKETPVEFETRYEWLRPGQLVARRNECPLIIVPVGPLEYHGPHMPLGTDAINAAEVAHACCRKLRKGVVLPTLFIGTERERTPAILESLGLPAGTYVVGMDFPNRTWNSHYLPQEIFAIRLAAELRILIGQGYKYILVANGHGATNQIDTVNRLCIELSNTTPAKLAWRLPVAQRVIDDNSAGHANRAETALLMHFKRDAVDVGALPPRNVPIRSFEFSIVDGIGFSPQYHRDFVVRHDPRDATPEAGNDLFQESVDELVAEAKKLIA